MFGFVDSVDVDVVFSVDVEHGLLVVGAMFGMVVSSTFGCGVWLSVCCVGACVLIVSSAVVGEREFGIMDSYFGHCFAICPGSLHLKQFDWSVVANIRY